MSADPQSRQPLRSLPQDLSLDELTLYIYDHFSSLLSEEEQAAKQVWTGRTKQFWYRPEGNDTLVFFGVPEVEVRFPDLMQRISKRGLASVMRAAAERVLRDHPDKRIVQTCARCGTLCRTPEAQQCFACGFDWHAGGND